MLAFFGAMLALLLAALDQSIVATALPRIAADLHGFSNLSWVVVAYLLASTATVPLYGKLSDLYGRRAMFVIAIAIFLVGSALCGAAQSMTELIVFRAIQGLGAGGLFPLVQALVDYLGSATLTAAIVSVLMIAVWGGSAYAWGSPEILALAAAAVVLLALFMLIERRAREPVIPLWLFASSIVRSTSLAIFAVGAVLFGTLNFLPVLAPGLLRLVRANFGSP